MKHRRMDTNLFFYLHHNSQSLIIIFVHWTQLLEYRSHETYYVMNYISSQDSQVDVILLASQGVSFTEVQEGLIVRRRVSTLRLLVSI